MLWCVLDCFAQSLHCLGYALALVKDGGTGNEQVGAGLDYLWDCGLVNAAIDFYIALQVSLSDHLAKTGNFGEGLGNEFLAPKAWIDGHDEDQVEKGEDVFEHEDGC